MNEKIYDAKEFKNIREIINNSVNEYPDNIAFTIKIKENDKVEYKKITYKEFQNDINGFGTELINSLKLKDKKIAVIGKNRYEWAVTYLSVINGVGVIVPLDKGLPIQEIESSLIRTKAEAIVFEKSNLDNIKQIIKNNKTNLKQFICMDKINEEGFYDFNELVENGKKQVESGKKEFIDADIDENAPKIILFTSGTTSLAKAVMLCHKNIAANIYAMKTVEKFYSTDTNIAFLPFHHTFGITGLIVFLSCGTNNVFCDGIRHIATNLKEYKVSIFVAVPLILESMHKKIMSEIAKQNKTKKVKFGMKVSNFLLKFGIDIRRKIFKEIIDNLGGNLRFVISGAAALDKQVAQDFNTFGILTVQGYGLTETSPVIAAENIKNIKYGSVGFPMCNVDVKIDNPNEAGIGEIVVKGPNVMLGYYEDENATKEVIKDGWFYTGDLGYIDKDGYIFITGRKKNVIVLKNGKNIYPEELELLIDNLSYVAESFVFGYPKDDDLIVSAKIVYDKELIETENQNISQKEIEEKIWKDIKNINKDLTNYKHIKKIIVTDEPMIKTTTNKIKRFEEMKKIMNDTKNS